MSKILYFKMKTISFIASFHVCTHWLGSRVHLTLIIFQIGYEPTEIEAFFIATAVLNLMTKILYSTNKLEQFI